MNRVKFKFLLMFHILLISFPCPSLSATALKCYICEEKEDQATGYENCGDGVPTSSLFATEKECATGCQKAIVVRDGTRIGVTKDCGYISSIYQCFLRNAGVGSNNCVKKLKESEAIKMVRKCVTITDKRPRLLQLENDEPSINTLNSSAASVELKLAGKTQWIPPSGRVNEEDGEKKPTDGMFELCQCTNNHCNGGNRLSKWANRGIIGLISTVTFNSGLIAIY